MKMLILPIGLALVIHSLCMLSLWDQLRLIILPGFCLSFINKHWISFIQCSSLWSRLDRLVMKSLYTRHHLPALSFIDMHRIGCTQFFSLCGQCYVDLCQCCSYMTIWWVYLFHTTSLDKCRICEVSVWKEHVQSFCEKVSFLNADLKVLRGECLATPGGCVVILQYRTIYVYWFLCSFRVTCELIMWPQRSGDVPDPEVV